MNSLYRIVLVLAALFYFFNVDAASTIANSKLVKLNTPTYTHPLPGNQIDRNLRDENNEERGISSTLGLDKIKALVKSLTKKIKSLFVKPKPGQQNFPDETFPHTFSAAQSLGGRVSTLQARQIQRWQDKGMTPGEVYKQLQLDRFNEPHFDKIENTVFGYLGFNTWVKYVDDFNEKNPTKKESMIPSLLTLYSDIDLSRVLEMAKKASTTEALARKLRMEQIQRWMTDGKSPGYVFKMFMVDSKVDELLTNPQFIAWTKYVDEFNAKNPANKASMIPPIVTHYGDDAVFGMLEAAKKVQSTEKLASKLQAEQIQKLLSSNHSPTYVFKALNLDKTGDEVFSTPLFTTWFNYLKTFNDKNPDKKESLLTSIHRYYQDHGVARIVEKAMTNPSTVKLANQLQDERYSRWLLNESSPQSAFYVFILTKPGADDVIRFRERPDRSKYLLPLEKVSDDLLSSPDFKRWAQYLDDFNAKYPDKQTSMSAVFRAYYTDDALENMLAAARKDPSTRDIASTLEKALFNV